MPTDTSSPGRLRYAAGLIRLAARLVLFPKTPVPAPRLTVPVPPGERGARLAALHEIADGLGVTERKGDGLLYAAARFGCLTVTAHVPADDLTARFRALGAPEFEALTGAARGWASGDIPGGAA